ncbi:GH1 family beta-glucosidase [Euzebya tangerina]|uniref:GH1 family beta-glucosidase n=1 Tax=Euzebya tangerina TaxID=591198 RepID=UPI00196B22A8|nr:GH1 family beta-glucosidase [Euzebya tangerina]
MTTTPDPTSLRMPAGFSWGVATSAHQIEGAVAVDGRAPSIWDTFSHTPGKVDRGENADVSCDHYHRFRDDIALMAQLGVDTYRFSLSWSRLLPEDDKTVNPLGATFYRSVCEELVEHGIRPVVCLFHWDLPQRLQDQGGWANPESSQWFAEYATRAKETLADLATTWMTLNEPYCAAFLGHHSGVHAPGVTDAGTAYLAAHNMLLAHHRAAAVLRSTEPNPDDEVTIALNLIPATGATDSAADTAAAAKADMVQNQLFLDGVLQGRYPDQIREHHHTFGVADQIDTDELAAIAQPIDWLAVNYYNVTHVAHQDGAPSLLGFPGATETIGVEPPPPRTEMGWGIEPQGLDRVLRRVGAAYRDLPIVISENGGAFPDVVQHDGSIDDQDRIAYLHDHLQVVAAASRDGIDVVGYHVWSLLDNFEWALGFSKRFGIVRVDFDTLERTPKASARWYAQVIAANRSQS